MSVFIELQNRAKGSRKKGEEGCGIGIYDRNIR